MTFDYYTRPTAITATTRHAEAIAGLPRDVGTLTRIIQGISIHEYMAKEYGYQVPEERKQESHIRHVDDMLDRIFELDPRPLSIERPPPRRLVGICQHFSSLLVGFLRAKGIPARARYGFGSYFNPGYYEEHTVCEYWNRDEERWILVDPQFDELWRSRLKITHDVFDVPRDRYLVAGDAWSQYRSGNLDPGKVGIFVNNLRGVWFIAAELVRDFAALNKVELLPWDQWGAMPAPEDSIGGDQVGFYDELARIGSHPDAHFGELQSRYQGNERLRVPPVVFNALRTRPEPVAAGV